MAAQLWRVGNLNNGNTAAYPLIDIAPELTGHRLRCRIGHPGGIAMFVFAGDLAIAASVAPSDVNQKCFHGLLLNDHAVQDSAMGGVV